MTVVIAYSRMIRARSRSECSRPEGWRNGPSELVIGATATARDSIERWALLVDVVKLIDDGDEGQRSHWEEVATCGIFSFPYLAKQRRTTQIRHDEHGRPGAIAHRIEEVQTFGPWRTTGAAHPVPRDAMSMFRPMLSVQPCGVEAGYWDSLGASLQMEAVEWIDALCALSAGDRVRLLARWARYDIDT